MRNIIWIQFQTKNFREVIERRPGKYPEYKYLFTIGFPDEFKIECLTELKSLFPTEQPFFAGFGNRETVYNATYKHPSKR